MRKSALKTMSFSFYRDGSLGCNHGCGRIFYEGAAEKGKEMALLTLKDIGKIYVSEGNVAVGIRGVNLSFESGEFVAITGKSGSGKSTLLNIISGMDSYEEGELWIEGQPTSHYLQPEWEEYRKNYISFIFQDYNIIDSFTVLQNVELALMHIEDKKARRTRAMELIRRVGLSAQAKQKGSRLSGGQKQRTVIARALAKDSPIILADEPTGNLDSATSKEIIELLYEVSKEKLLIVVTHNFEQVEAYATRHIRIFDGAVESDTLVRTAVQTERLPADSDARAAIGEKFSKKQLLCHGMTLGKTLFTAKPKLTSFLCFLLILGTLGLFFVTALCGDASTMFEPYEMFCHINGRVIVTKQSGEVLTDEELQQLASEYGAVDFLHYDVLLDEGRKYHAEIPTQGDKKRGYITMNCTYLSDFGDSVLGRYPTAANEVLLYLPISYRPTFGKDALQISEIMLNSMQLRVTGVKYYYDNHLTPQCLFTEEGFRVVTAMHYLQNNSDYSLELSVSGDDGSQHQFSVSSFIPVWNMDSDKIYISSDSYHSLYSSSDVTYTTNLRFLSVYRKYNYNFGDSVRSVSFERTFGDESITAEKPTVDSATFSQYAKTDTAWIGTDLFCQIAEEELKESYKQASLFFSDDKAAYAAAEQLQEAGYIAVPSDTTYEPDASTTVLTLLSCVLTALVWVFAVIFLAFFIYLCTFRTLGAFRNELAIMRSMGIPVTVIRIGMYARMLLSLIPALLLMIAAAILIFASPTWNGYFDYLYAWQYLLIFGGMIAITVRVTYKQIKKLFGESVKKSLKGGTAE